MISKYVNPFTDFGFKKIFGEEGSKFLLMDFLNTLLPEENKISSLTLKNSENLPRTELERRAIFDIYCMNQKGERFIVELQKAKQNLFKERTIYYSTFPIMEQAEKGFWDFDLKAVFCIGILDFCFDSFLDKDEKCEVVHEIKLKNQNGKVFYDKLTYIYLELPHFTKKEEELSTQLDKWLYFIKHLEDFEEIPTIFKTEVFENAFEKAELAKFKPGEMDAYEGSLKDFRVTHAVIATAYSDGEIKGRQEGRQEGILDMAKKLVLSGMEIEKISEITGISKQALDQF
jgi:predicted transposase/invertase (TIGR01784 family)